MTERPETITLAGVELRWSDAVGGYASADAGVRPRFVAYVDEYGHHCAIRLRGDDRIEVRGHASWDALDAAVRAALIETRDACAAIVGPGVDVEAIRAEEREQTFRGVMQMVPAEHRIACREGGGPEDVEGSVSLSIARMRSLIPAVRT